MRNNKAKDALNKKEVKLSIFLIKQFVIGAALFLAVLLNKEILLNTVRSNADYRDIPVKKVIDGDTIKLENNQKVRFIGIDAPEYHESAKLYRDSSRSGKDIKAIQKMGHRSYEYLKGLIEGERVRLEFDVERYDKYNRLLAYVYLKNGIFVNARMIEEGYATVYTFPPNVRHTKEFLKLQTRARDLKAGLWQDGLE